MEVALPMPVPVPVPMGDFNFDSTCTTPYASAPTSPRPFGGSCGTTPYASAPSSPGPFGGGSSSSRYFYTSAPTSPSRASAIYAQFRGAASVAPFDWESETPETPDHLHHQQQEDEDDAYSVDFAFQFSGQLVGGDDAVTATADELFEAGRIRPITPISSRVFDSSASRPESPFSPRPSKGEATPQTPRLRAKHADPFERRAERQASRGRDHGNLPASTSRRSGSRRATRSLSPYRGGSDFGARTHATPADASPSHSPANPAASSGLTKGGSKKWRLRDFFLFRSVSEGRATGARAADPLRKYAPISPVAATLLSRRMEAEADAKCASFRSVDGGSSHGGSRRGTTRPSGSRIASVSGDGSVGRSSRMRTAPPEEVRRRKTLLPYKQGLFGFFGFH